MKGQQNIEEDSTFGAYMISAMTSMLYVMITPIFGGINPAWYLLIIAIAAAAGYFSNRANPIPYIAGCVTFVLAFPGTYGYYFAGRDSFVNLELFIPIIMAFVPALIIQMILVFLMKKFRG